MDPTYTLEYEYFETHYWWHQVRQRIIQNAIGRFGPDPATGRWLDVGCGTGVLLDSYPRIPNRMGLELDEGSVQRGREKGLDIRRTEPVWDFKAYGTFDLVTMCDVIEHVEHEQSAVAAVREVLNPGGTVLITVPALMSLWSGHDIVNHHFRRYNRRSLLANFPQDQWEVLKCSYFSTFLLPTIWMFRKIKNLREGLDPAQATHDKHFGPWWVDGTFKAIFSLEVPWLRFAGLPIGSSLILVARKK